MKAFWTGTVAAIVIAIVAGFILKAENESAKAAFTTSSARVSSN